MTQPDYVWGALLLAGAAYEAYTLKTKRSGDTLSETTRRWSRVRTPLGRAVFTLAWAGFSIWYLIHITEPWK